MFDIDLSGLPETDEEGAEGAERAARRWQREKTENRFLDFVAMMQTGAAAIRRVRDLEERLAKAEADAAEWRKIAMGGTDVMAGMVLDMVTALGTGALTLSDDPEKRAKAVELMGRRNPESV